MLGVLVAVLVAAACTSGDETPGAGADSPTPGGDATTEPTTEPTPARGGSFKYQLRYDPEFIDPGYVLESEGTAVVDALFDSLLTTGEDLEVEPAAAEDWEVNEDGTVYTFHLDPDATFHDGTSVTAGDFIRAWTRNVDRTSGDLSPNAHHLMPVKGFEETRDTGAALAGLSAPDQQTLVVELQFPYFGFENVVAHPSLAPVPPIATEDLSSFREAPVGNGPFEMAQEWVHDQFIRVSRNEDYYGQVPALDEIVFQIYGGEGDEGRAYSDFQEGLLHFAVVPASEREDAVDTYGASDDGYTGPGVLDGESLILYYFGFNTQKPPFDDPEVRRGLSMLVDREGLAESVMQGTRTPARSVTPPTVPGSEPDTCEACTHAPERAEELLAGKDLDGIRLVHNDHPVQRRIAERVTSDISVALDVEVEAVGREFDEFLGDIRAGDIGFFRLGWEAEYATLDNFVTTHFASLSLGDTNVFRYSEPEVDQLIEQARSTADATERRDLYVQAERRALQDVPLTPMMFFQHSRVVADSVRGFTYRPDGLVDMTSVRLLGES